MMSRNRIVVCSHNKAARLVVERDVIGFDRQAINYRLYQAAANEARHTLVKRSDAMAQIHRIACEEFVASVAAQGHRDVLARETRKQKGRHKRRVAERLV